MESNRKPINIKRKREREKPKKRQKFTETVSFT